MNLGTKCIVQLRVWQFCQTSFGVSLYKVSIKGCRIRLRQHVQRSTESARCYWRRSAAQYTIRTSGQVQAA